MRVSCGRCEDSCPAFEAGKPLSPRNVVQDLVGVMNGPGFSQPLHGEPIAAETLWSCTTCGACADVCPLGISPMRMITDMRRFLIGEAPCGARRQLRCRKRTVQAIRGDYRPAIVWLGRAVRCAARKRIKNLTYCTGLAVPRHTIGASRKWLAALYDCSRRLR